MELPFGVHHGDCLDGMRGLPNECAQIVICDPPYNIGKDFGNTSDRQELNTYIEWCKTWLEEAVRILKQDGTLYVYGISEILAHVQVNALPVNEKLHIRWLIWHYTNKNVPGFKFWQRSHEAILCITKKRIPVFNIDEVREPYTDSYIKNAAGKTRKATVGRYSNGEVTTTYNAHEKGALPRDVIKLPALAGGAGKVERVNHPTQKPLSMCRKLLQAASVPNGVVVVPFAGSGSECVAAKELGLPYIAYEINVEYIGIIEERLAGDKGDDEVAEAVVGGGGKVDASAEVAGSEASAGGAVVGSSEAVAVAVAVVKKARKPRAKKATST